MGAGQGAVAGRRLRRWGLRGSLGLALLAVGVGLATTLAGAAVTTIGFDDLDPGTQVREQYAAEGVTFGEPGGDHLRLEATDRAPSPRNVASFANCIPGGACDNAIQAQLSTPASNVALVAGSLATSGRALHVVYLEALDESGAVIATDTASVPDTGGFTRELEVASPDGSAAITGFRLRVGSGPAPDSKIAFDNLAITVPGSSPGTGTSTQPTGTDTTRTGTQTTPAPPPTTPTTPRALPPDFGLSLRAGLEPVSTATVSLGDPERLRLRINRFQGSTGPIALEVNRGQRSAPGVSLKLTPDPKVADQYDLEIDAHGLAALGQSTVTITGKPSSASAGSVDRSISFVLRVVNKYDARIIGMHVSQGTQEAVLQGPGADSLGDPVSYEGVTLTEGPETVVRVFANVAGVSKLQGVRVALYGTDMKSGKALPGSPLTHVERTLEKGPSVGGQQELTADKNSFTLTIPHAWSADNRTISLRAVLLPPPGGTVTSGTGSECELGACKVNNDFTVRGIQFRRMPRLTILPVELTTSGDSRPDPKKVFDLAKVVTPAGGTDYFLRPYAAEIDVTDVAEAGGTLKARNAAVGAKVVEWGQANKHMLDAMTILVGVHDGEVAGGVSWGNIGQMLASLQDGSDVAMPRALVRGTLVRPLTSVAHEIGHQLGRPHASTSCGADSGANLGEPWPPDQIGQLNGIGIDRRPFSGPIGGHRLIYDDPSLPNGVAFDYMSYCTAIDPDSDSWISPRNWNNMYSAFKLYMDLASKFGVDVAAAGAAGEEPGSLEVYGEVAGGSTAIFDVVPSDEPAKTAASEAGDHRVVARDASGNVVATVPADVDETHIDERPPVNVASFFARVPAEGVRSVELQAPDGQSLTRRDASPSAPAVTLASPRSGTKVPRHGTTEVRAQIADPDPGTKLRVALRVSDDGGRSFRTLLSQPASPGSVTFKVRNSSLPGSRRGAGRIALVANDGFNQGDAVSGKLTFAGTPPVVEIEGPRRGRIRSDQAISFTGTAVDDEGLPIRDRALTWFDGRRRVGRGGELSLARLAPGKHVLRLEARDQRSRVGQRKVKLRVAAARPAFLVASGPRKLGRKAKRVKLRIASSLPAKLRVAGRSYKVGPRARKVRVRLSRGNRPKALRLRLVAGGKRSSLRLELPRGS